MPEINTDRQRLSDSPDAIWQQHRWDRPFFTVMLVAIWAAILSGFVPTNVQKYIKGQLTYPWIVHIHAFFFTGWLFFFTAQMLWVRRGQLSTHRKLGLFGAGLAAVMVVLGLLTAIITEELKFGTGAADVKFLSVMFADMALFGGLVAAGMLARRSPAAHKRLMLTATLVLTVAGFSRWLSPHIGEWLGQRHFWELQTWEEGAWPFIRHQLLPAYLLIAAIGVFDLITRKRLHPAYVRAVLICLPVHVLAGWLYFQPFWKSAALRIIGQ